MITAASNEPPRQRPRAQAPDELLTQSEDFPVLKVNFSKMACGIP